MLMSLYFREVRESLNSASYYIVLGRWIKIPSYDVNTYREEQEVTRGLIVGTGGCEGGGGGATY